MQKEAKETAPVCRIDWKLVTGICQECGEHTSLTQSCCGAPVSFEGCSYSLEDFCDHDDLHHNCLICRGAFQHG